jgi:hypothetical protein
MDIDHTCARCGEPLTPDDFPRTHRYNYRSSWDSCMRAATGDDERILHVHRKMAEASPLMAREYDGDR